MHRAAKSMSETVMLCNFVISAAVRSRRRAAARRGDAGECLVGDGIAMVYRSAEIIQCHLVNDQLAYFLCVVLVANVADCGEDRGSIVFNYCHRVLTSQVIPNCFSK